MKPKSAKAKGRALQNMVRAAILKRFPQLGEDDVKCAVMGESGRDLHLSPAAQAVFPYSTECKNTERLSLWESIAQAEANAGDLIPLLIFKRNRSKAYVVMGLDDFLDRVA